MHSENGHTKHGKVHKISQSPVHFSCGQTQKIVQKGNQTFFKELKNDNLHTLICFQTVLMDFFQLVHLQLDWDFF